MIILRFQRPILPLQHRGWRTRNQATGGRSCQLTSTAISIAHSVDCLDRGDHSPCLVAGGSTACRFVEARFQAWSSRSGAPALPATRWRRWRWLWLHDSEIRIFPVDLQRKKFGGYFGCWQFGTGLGIYNKYIAVRKERFNQLIVHLSFTVLVTLLYMEIHIFNNHIHRCNRST